MVADVVVAGDDFDDAAQASIEPRIAGVDAQRTTIERRELGAGSHHPDVLSPDALQQGRRQLLIAASEQKPCAREKLTTTTVSASTMRVDRRCVSVARDEPTVANDVHTIERAGDAEAFFDGIVVLPGPITVVPPRSVTRSATHAAISSSTSASDSRPPTLRC